MQLLSLLIDWGIPMIFSATVGLAIGMLRQWKQLKEGLKCLLRVDIINICESVLRDGYIDIAMREALTRSYGAYHGLRGNGVIDDLYKRTMALPIHK